MAGLESITVCYLPGAEGFLCRRGEGLAIDVRTEGVFSSGVNISAVQGAPVDDRGLRPRGYQYRGRTSRTLIAWLFLCLILALLAIPALLAGRQAVHSSDRDTNPARPRDALNSTATVFPLSAEISSLLANTVQLAQDVTFLGLSPHQTHRLLPGRTAGGVDMGGMQFERLWHGSLFNSAAIPLVDSLCGLVTRYDPVYRDRRGDSRQPEALAEEELLRLCQLAQASLYEANQAWHEARAVVRGLVRKVTRSCKSLGIAFWNADLFVTSWADTPPSDLWADQLATLAHLDYSHPLWQHWVMNTTLETLFPLGTPLPLAGSVSSAVSTLNHASAAALSYLTAIENTTSTWLYGVSGQESLRCYQGRLRLHWLQRLCSCAVGEPEDMQTARRLIHLTRRIKGFVALASEQADATTWLASKTVSGWEELRSALQAVQDGNLHTSEVGVADDETSHSAGPGCARRDERAITKTITKWTFETLESLGEAVPAAALSAELRWQSVCAYEKVLWNEAGSV